MELDSVVCADALEFLKGLPDKSVDCIISDPPYAATSNEWDKAPDWIALFKEFRRVLKDSDSPLVLFCNNRLFAYLITTFAPMFRYEIIIEKSNPSGFLNANRMPLSCHEYVAVFGVKGVRYFPQMVAGAVHDRGGGTGAMNNYGDFNRLKLTPSSEHYPRSVWQVTKPPDANVTKAQVNHRREVHPTEKDIALMQKLVLTFSRSDDVILDCFAGSGSTLIAARNTGRHFIGCDSHQPYVDMANLRLQNSDPYQASTLPNGSKQLSLFSGLE